jgi:hypothetical protein
VRQAFAVQPRLTSNELIAAFATRIGSSVEQQARLVQLVKRLCTKVGKNALGVDTFQLRDA